jgi:DNA-binding beta-propeller fold protein YncE
VVTFGGGTLAAPLGIAYASGGYLWVTDFTNATLSKWTTAGAAVTSFSTFNSGTMSFSDIFQVAIDPATGNLYVCERVKSHIDVFDPTGVYLTNFGSAQFSSGPTGVAINSSGTTVYGADQGNNRCYAYSISGTPSSPVFTYRFTFANSDGVANTQLMNMDSNDHVWFADATNSLLLEYDATGVHQRTVTQTGYGFTAGALDGQGNIFAVSDGPNILFEYNQANAPVTQYSNGFNNPYGMTFNDTKDYFYVTNFGAGNVVGFKRN